MEDPSTMSFKTSRFRATCVTVALVASVLLPASSAVANHTPNPTSVTIAGSLQGEAGCPDDWQPGCAATHLTYDANDDVWQGSFSLPAGSYEYKAALNNDWAENYGLHAVSNGPNIPTTVASAGSTKFYYDHESHWATDNRSAVIATAVGSFQAATGCSGDWDPTCLRSWLQDVDGDGTYTFETTALPHGSYEGKVAINEDWAENYGAGGTPGGGNIAFSVPSDGTKVTFSYVSTTHVLTITVAVDHGAPGGPGALSHFDLARKDCLGTARNTTSKVWYTVADGVLSDVYYPTVDNTNLETLQYIVTDGTTFTDLQTRDMTYDVEAVKDTGGMACKVTATANSGMYKIETEYITDPDRNAVVMHVAFKPKPQEERSAAVRPLRPDGQRQRRRRLGQRRRGFGHGRHHDRPPDPRRLGSGDRDERGQPRLRAAGLCGARWVVHGGFERLRRLRERRAPAARFDADPDADLPRCPRGQRRRHRARRAQGRRQDRPHARVRRDAG